MTETEEDSFFFNSDCFDVDLFDNLTINDRRATKEEKLELLKFIGGFEKWPELDDDCRMYVIGFLDYYTRCQLSLCSKKDNQVVKDTVLCITKGILPQNDGVRMRHRNLAALCKSDYEQNHREEAAVSKVIMKDTSIHMHTTSNFIRSWRFIQKGDEVLVTSKSSLLPDYMYHTTFKIANGDANREFEKIVKKVMNKAKSSVELLEIHSVLNVKNIEFDKLEKLKYLKLHARDHDTIPFWLSRLNPELPLEELVLDTQRDLNFERMNYPSTRNAGEMQVTRNVHITDEEFLALNVRKFSFITDSLSLQALMEFVRKWVDDELREDFEQCQIWTKHDYRKEIVKILDSYNFNATPYNYESFRINPYEFFSRFHRYGWAGKFWQISKRNDPFSSVSLFVNQNVFIVYRTGFPCIRNGHEDVELRFPKDVYHRYYYYF